MTERILQTNAKWLLLIIGLLGIGLLSALLPAFVWGSADPVAAETPEFTHVVNSVEVIDDANLTDGICDTELDASADPPIPTSGKCTWLAARQSVVGVPGDHTITFAVDITEVYRGAFSQPPDTGDREDPENDKYLVTIQGPVAITFDEDPETFVFKQGLHFQKNYDGIFINEVWFKGDGTEALGFQDGGEGIRFGSNIDFFCTIANSHFTGLNRPFRLGVDADNNDCDIVGNWVGSSGPHHQDSGEAKIRESTAGVSRKPSSDGKARGCSSKHLCGLTAWNT